MVDMQAWLEKLPRIREEEALRAQEVREMHDLALRVIAVGYKVLAKEGRDRERLKRPVAARERG